MATEVNNIHAEAERIANEVFGERPTPEQIDDAAREYLEAKARSGAAHAEVEALEIKLVELVKSWGVVPPNAEKSRRLTGRFAELTVTKSDTITIDDERVIDLRDALKAAGREGFFKRLFAERTDFELVEGARKALQVESLPKRLSEKVLNMFGRCFHPKPKKPSLKVAIADPAKPAKKARGKQAEVKPLSNFMGIAGDQSKESVK